MTIGDLGGEVLYILKLQLLCDIRVRHRPNPAHAYPLSETPSQPYLPSRPACLGTREHNCSYR